MAAPLLIPALAGLAGAFGGWSLNEWMSGETKKSGEIHAPQEWFMPVNAQQTTTVDQRQYAPVVSYGWQGGDLFLESPGASSKKEMTTTQTSTPSQYASQQPSQAATGATPTEGLTNILPIALIAGIALVGYGYVSRGKKRG